jgi:ZIP family zinc transporter
MMRSLRIFGPLALIVLVAVGFMRLDPLAALTGSVPDIEEMNVERIVIDDEGFKLRVRAAGTDGITLAQVQVDGAYWAFKQIPPGKLDRLASAWVQVPYPWVRGETHHLTVLTSSGVTFDYSVDAAVPTPTPDAGMLRIYALIGIFVGLIPVALGMLFYPALRSAGPRTMVFVLALTMGLLAYLFVDTLAEALDLAEEPVAALSAWELVWLVMAATAGGMFAISRIMKNARGAVMLAWSIALGIGLHNFAEGLAIGGAFASGAMALGSFLVIGFTLHNITEGIGIVAPLTEERPAGWIFLGLAALAGLPAVLGIWLGAFAFDPYWAALALAVGAGAILQVLCEVGGLLQRRYLGIDARRYLASVMAGGLIGVVIMYGTSLVVAV